MIRVIVELDRFGLGQEREELARVLIGNDGTGTRTVGNYDVCAVRKGSPDNGSLDTANAFRRGRVESYSRQSLHVLTLVRKALEAMEF